MTYQLSLILALPIAGAIAVIATPARRADLARWLARGAAGAAFAASLRLWFAYDAQSAEFQFVERLPWIPPIGAGYFLGVDGFSVLLILLTTIVSAAATLCSWGQETTRTKTFDICLLLLESAVLGAFMALDLLLFLVFSTLVAGLSCAFVRTWDSGRPSAQRLAALGAAGSAAQMAAVLAIYLQHHTTTGIYSFDMTAFHQLEMPFATQSWIFLALLFGFGVLPLIVGVVGASVAPAAAAVMLAAVSVKIGSYGLLRVSLPIVPDAANYFGPYVAMAAGAAMIAAAFYAFAQKDGIRTAAWLSAGVGAVILAGMFSLAEDGIAGSMMQQISHGLSAAALLLLIRGPGYRRQGAIAAAGVLLAALSLAGAPLSGGFVGDRLILQSLFAADRLGALLTAGGLAACGAVTLVMCVRFLGATPARTSAAAAVRFRGLAVVAPLLGLSVWMGVSPAPFLERLKIAAHHVASHVDPSAGDATECDTVPTPEQLTATPGSQFLLAVPCGPNGEPLTPPSDGAAAK